MRFEGIQVTCGQSDMDVRCEAAADAAALMRRAL